MTFTFSEGSWRRSKTVVEGAPVARGRCAFWLDTIFFASYPLGNYTLYPSVLRVSALAIMKFDVPLTEISEVKVAKSFFHDKLILKLNGVDYQLLIFAAERRVAELGNHLAEPELKNYR